MRNYMAVVFDDPSKAYEGLHAIWQLDDEGEITVHGTTVVHRNDWGEYNVDAKDTHPALATAVGVGIGALLGALAGPAGAAVGAAKGAAIGAASGGAVGAVTDAARADTRDQSRYETGWVLGAGQSAVIADVSEDSTLPIDERMRRLGGTVHRRTWSAVRDDKWSDDRSLYPGISRRMTTTSTRTNTSRPIRLGGPEPSSKRRHDVSARRRRRDRGVAHPQFVVLAMSRVQHSVLD